MSAQFISYADGHVLVEYDGGLRLNINVQHLIDAADPTKQLPSGIPGRVPSLRPRVIDYLFRKGDVLAPHRHDTPEGLHDIVVKRGEVMVRREKSGDVVAKFGDRITVQLGELHSIEALEDSVTTHTLVSP